MEQRQIGSTDVRLSAVGLGGAWLGDSVEDSGDVSRAVSVLQAAGEAGINWVDTSENYFDTGNESVIGAALSELSGDFLVCSKVAPGALKSGGGSGFRPEQIRRACEMSLQRLGRGHLDSFLLHWPDKTGVPLTDTWDAMAGLVTDGLVRSIGLSNYEQAEIDACHARRPVDLIQTGLSLIEYLDDRDMITWCGEQGIAATIYEPLGSGILTDTSIQQVRDRWIGTAWEDDMLGGLLAPERVGRTEQVVDGVRAIAKQLDATTAEVAIAWVLHQPGVTSAIVGSSSPDRARANGRAAELHLSEEMLRALDELIPLGPTFG